MAIPAIPSKINNYNVYNVAERLIGVGDEVPLPDFEALADTISGAGILGELDDPTVGHFSNMEMEIPFRVIDQEAAEKLGLPCIWARSLPGRLVPATAAAAICDAVFYIIKERGDPE